MIDKYTPWKTTSRSSVADLKWSKQVERKIRLKALYPERPIAMWKITWELSSFRMGVFFGMILLSLIAFMFPYFFQLIEERKGVVLDDYILRMLQPRDVSILIFLLLYSVIGLTIRRAVQDPAIFINFLWSYVLLCMARFLSISLVELEPPIGFVALRDPLSIVFYHTNEITKDLFFSGHTATLVLCGLCLVQKRDKIIAFSASGIMALLLLIQHVHYTIDILAAVLFSFGLWYLGSRIGNTCKSD